jgi:Icc-related predicted phosphoesterase
MQKLRDIVTATQPDFMLVTGDLVKDALRVSEKEASGYYELYKKEIRQIHGACMECTRQSRNLWH